MTMGIVPPLADTWGMHGDIGPGWWIVMAAGMVLFWGVIILVGLRLLRDGFQRPTSPPPAETPTALLERRLAEGAITVEEYEQRRRALAEPAPIGLAATERSRAGAVTRGGTVGGDESIQ